MQSPSVFSFLQYLQSAFYTRNIDITRSAELQALAKSFGLDRDVFAEQFIDSESQRITQLNFEYARYCQVSGFPTLFGQSQGAHVVLTRGYMAFEQISNNINQWLEPRT